MKNIKVYILSVLALFASFSCEKALDINTNPLVASSADPNVVLPYVFVQYSNRKVTELGTRTLDVSQHHSANFNSPRNGSTSIFLTGNTWNMMYTQVLGNLALVEADAKEAGVTNNNIAAIAVILKGMVYFELTSIWENVPFSEAINGAEFQAPQFDNQQDVLNGVVTLLDEGMALIDALPADGVADVSTGDILYGGDVVSWRKLANSLKIRTLMLLRRGGDATAETRLVTAFGQPVIDDNADVAMIRYAGNAGEQNGFQQLNEAFFGTSNEATEVYAPGPPLHALVSGGAHPMGEMILRDINEPSPTNGAFANTGEAVLSDNVIRNNLPDVWFTPAELSLYKAELALGGVGVSGTAKQNFDTGVTQLLEWWGGDIPGATKSIDAADITAYLATVPAPTLADIHDELYLDTFMRPVVAWNHVRRATSPVLLPPSTTSITSILKRFNYPPAEVSANPNTPVNPRTDEPMWFEGN